LSFQMWALGKRDDVVRVEQRRHDEIRAKPPPHKANHEERVPVGLEYVDWGWTKKEAYMAAGISKGCLDRALEIGGVPVMGRPTSLSDAQARELETLVTKAGINLQAPRLDGDIDDERSFVNMALGVIRKGMSNPYVELKAPDPKTLKIWIAQVDGVVRSADTKAEHRFKAYMNLRTPYAMAVALPVVFGVADMELVFSMDDVSFFAHKWDPSQKIRVIANTKSLEYMAAARLGVSVLESNPEFHCQRMVTLNFTLGGRGFDACKVIKVCDHAFDVNKPECYVWNPRRRIFLLLFNPSTPKELVSICMYKTSILPSVEAKRQECISTALEALRPIDFSQPQEHSQQDSASQRASAAGALTEEQAAAAEAVARAEVLERFATAVCLSDGEYFQIKSIEEELIRHCKRRNLPILFGKFSSGASMTQSPNDVGKGLHMVVHKEFNSQNFRCEAECVDPPGDIVQLVKKDLQKKLAAKDFKSLWHVLQWSEKVIEKACTPAHIESAFHDAGIVTRKGIMRVQNGETTDPSDPIKILSKCPHFKDLQQAEADKLITLIPTFSEIVAKRGFVLECKQKQ
jgi:hypothetical protein